MAFDTAGRMLASDSANGAINIWGSASMSTGDNTIGLLANPVPEPAPLAVLATRVERPSTGSAVAAIVSPLAFGLIVDLTGSWVLHFAVSIALLLLGCAMAFTMHPERRFAEAMPGTATIGAG